jgi:UDP-glucose 4-epimerase
MDYMQNKKILITGSSGFIGSHVADALTKKGHDVILFDSEESKYKKENQKEVVGSLLSIQDVSKAIKGCDVVYHFAAQADIETSRNDPLKTIETNIIGTHNILDAAKKAKIKRFIFASTIYVYSDLGSFYRVSKQACEKIIEEYQKEFNLNFTILRFGSLYGPRANNFNGIKSFLMQALKNKKIVRKGNGNEVREYIHVKDAAKLSIKALKQNYKNKHLIISGNQQIKVKDLLLMIKEIFNSKIQIEFGKEEELYHYDITPYNYKPQIAKKITSNTFYDIGQGLIDQIYDIDKEINKKNDIKINLRKHNK